MTSNRGLTLLLGLVLVALTICEPPHLKYTREVNEAAQKGVDVDNHAHGHSHGAGGGCSHGHSHEDHDHSHHDHGHSQHDHGHSQHDHGHSQHDHGHSQHDHGHSHHEPHSNGAGSHSPGHSHDKPAAKKSAHSAGGKGKKEHTFDSNGMLYFLNDTRTRLWVYSIGSTLLISAFPCLILAFIPIQSDTDENSTLLKLLLAFGAGGLLGDAFLHLIPHATPAPKEGHTHSHSHGGGEYGHAHEPHDLSVGQYVVAGFMVFFIVEKFVRIMRGDDSPHGHSHSHAPPPPAIKTAARKAKDSDASDDTAADSEASQNSSAGAAKRRGSKSTATAVVHPTEEKPRIRVAAYLNLVADFMHNFTDGLAIGASFIAGSTVGIVTMVTVLVHEVPHEIGDFAILIRSGYSKPKAMLIQLCTALGALAGCLISLLSVDAYALAEAAEQSWVLPFTAGGFIYIATVSVIPELLERSTFWQSVWETFAIVLGLFLMYLIAFYE